MSVEAIMRKQRGLITQRQALDVGVSKRTIEYRLRSGAWARVQPRVYRHTVVPPSWEQQLMAATLVGEQVVASHRSAAVLFGLWQFGEPIPEVTQPHALAKLRLRSVHLHRSTQWTTRQEEVRRGIPCTGIDRTLMDVAALVSVDVVERLAEEAVRRRLTSFGSLASYLACHGKQGRTGAANLRAMLRRRSPTAPLPLSDFSRLVSTLLRNAGLPEPRLEHRICDRAGRFIMQADLAWPQLRKIVELDGLAWHFGREDVERDRRKRARAQAEGWHIVEILWSMLADDADALIELIGNFLRS